MPDPEGALLDRAIAGDTESLRILLERYGPQVGRGIQRKIGKQWRGLLDGDDVMQVTYLQACLHIDQLAERKPASFVAWLTRIAENNLHDAINELERPKRPQPKRQIQAPPAGSSYVALLELLASDTATPSRKAALHEAVEIIDSALSRLPPDYEKAVRLYDLEGRPIEEVAGAMGRSVGAVHMLRARAHERLRHVLGSASKFFSDSS